MLVADDNVMSGLSKGSLRGMTIGWKNHSKRKHIFPEMGQVSQGHVGAERNIDEAPREAGLWDPIHEVAASSLSPRHLREAAPDMELELAEGTRQLLSLRKPGQAGAGSGRGDFLGHLTTCNLSTAK